MPDPNSYQAIGWLVVGLAALVAIANQGLAFYRNVRRSSVPERRMIQEPLTVKPAESYALEQDCSERAGALQQQIDELRRLRETDDLVASKHRKAVYDKIEAVRLELSAKIDQMPAAITAQLLNTKQLWKS